MINSIYGKTMENDNEYTSFFKYTSRPTHNTHKIFDKNYAAIHEIKPVLTLTSQFMLDLISLNQANG